MTGEWSPKKILRDGERLEGNGIYLRPVEMSDCNERYVAWLRDPEVNKFLETRWQEHTLVTVREFVATMRASDDNYLFAIVDSGTDRHVGNIKVGPVNAVHSNAEVSYFVGDKAMWGKGIATEAIRLATAFGFERLRLHRLQAGVYEENVASAKALGRVGYVKEGVFREKLRLGARWNDHIVYGIVNPRRRDRR